jgi:nitrite reductase/ring-hydroxylating ferredoxin subunit
LKAPPPLYLADDTCGPPSGSVLADIAALPDHGGKAIQYKADDGKVLNIFIQKIEGVIAAYENVCPHAGTPLNLFNDKFLDLDNKYLLCRTHGAKFDVNTGECIAGPCKHEFLRKIAFEIKDGRFVISK